MIEDKAKREKGKDRKKNQPYMTAGFPLVKHACRQHLLIFFCSSEKAVQKSYLATDFSTIPVNKENKETANLTAIKSLI